jgi:predicted transcriptional regulator YdeE
MSIQRKDEVQRDEMTVVGVAARTSQRDDSSKIGELWQRFFQEKVPDAIDEKAGEGHMLELYAEYAGDEHDEYTVMLGFEVPPAAAALDAFKTVTLPAATYVVFSSERGPLDKVIPEAWKEIWTMDSSQLGGERTFTGDFEIFDERSSDRENGVVDIFVAIDK